METVDRYDVVVIGGALAGSAAGLLLKRWCPGARVLIVEKRVEFSRKVGEATVELSGYFLQRVLGQADHLAREHLPKQGLRYWFADGPETPLHEMSELGGRGVAQLPSFLLDRAVFDEHLSRQAVEAGCELLRPARIVDVDLDWPSSRLIVEDQRGQREVETRWVIDASGRQAYLAKRMKLQHPVPEHPISAAWARWNGVADFEGPSIQGPDVRRPRLRPLEAPRRLATNHFCGYGWWCWMIALKSGQTSVGVVFQRELFDLPGTGTLEERYRAFVTSQPGLRELLSEASMEDGDFLAQRTIPYRTEKYMGRGWALISDAAAFVDPYYSPGLDHTSVSTFATVQLIEADLVGDLDEPGLDRRIRRHNQDFLRSYPRWMESLYVGKYELFGDAELTACAFLVDTSLYYLAVVAPVYRDLEAFSHPMFGLPIPQTRFAWRFMRFFNHRLNRIARIRREIGRYGRRNRNWRVYSPSFHFGWSSVKPLLRGLSLWGRMELQCVGWRLRGKRFPEKSLPVPHLPLEVASEVAAGSSPDG